MSGIFISIINRSTVLQDSDVSKIVSPFQTQVSRDLADAWGTDATLDFVPNNKKPDPNHWQLVILDDSDQAGALGYHDLTQSGQPLGKVFAKSDLKYGLNWTVTASHELLEMIIDPNINLVAFSPKGTLYAYEVCDACEADEFGYKIGSIWVSDFVFPGWFEPLHVTQGETFDYQGEIKKPFELLKGGYIGVYQIQSGSGWKQLTKNKTPRTKPQIGSRRYRRKIPMTQWKRSRS